jgi:hypothetical protein
MSGTLKFKRSTNPTKRLPYIGTDHFKPKHGHCLWDVPLTGDYGGGWKTGQALAIIALKFSKEFYEGAGGHLNTIAAAWLDRARSASPDEFETLRGQVLGFMRAVEVAALLGLDRCDITSAAWDSNARLKEANHGLSMRGPAEWKR